MDTDPSTQYLLLSQMRKGQLEWRHTVERMISRDLLDILACPACSDRPPVTLSSSEEYLECGKCGRQYPIKDDIPVMLVEEAVLPKRTEEEADGASA